MKKFKRTLSLLMMSTMLILPVSAPVQAKEIDNCTKESVTYNNEQYGNATIIANNVNIRKGPGTSYTSLGQLNYGDRIKLSTSIVHDTSGRVWQSCYTESGLFGFVALDYVRKD